MKTIIKKLFFVLTVILLSQCEKDLPPLIETELLTDITDEGAYCCALIKNAGGSLIIAQGFCWSTHQNPTLSDNFISIPGGSSRYTYKITDLYPNTIYYIRAYATNNDGTFYENNISRFKTYTGSVVDFEGNTYYTVTIGSQIWIAENLKSTTLNDGTIVLTIKDNRDWRNTKGPGCCFLNNEEYKYKNIFGALYNYFTIVTGKLCPDGWHVASESDWSTLIDFLGGIDATGKKLKSRKYWENLNVVGNNEYGFSALPGGSRWSGGGWPDQMGTSGFWWSFDPNIATGWYMHNYSERIIRTPSQYKTNGYSVRCVKDD